MGNTGAGRIGGLILPVLTGLIGLFYGRPLSAGVGLLGGGGMLGGGVCQDAHITSPADIRAVTTCTSTSSYHLFGRK